MSQDVHLRIAKYLEGQSIDNGALVEIRALESDGTSRRVQRVAVPASEDAARFRQVSLDPGRYEFTAYLPSGDLASEIVEVAATARALDVVLRGDSSPHEWMSWQHLFGNVADREGAAALRASYALSAPAVQDSFTSFAAELWQVPYSPAPAPDLLGQNVASWLAQAAPGMPVPMARLMPSGATVQALSLLRDPPYAQVRLPLGAPPSDRRAYLCVHDAAGRAVLCPLELPWFQSDGSGEAQIEAVVAIDEESLAGGPDGASWSVRPSVRDAQIGTVLSYFASGDAPIARELLEPARELLFEKLVNPVAAAGGGYVLADHWIRESSAAPGTVPPWFQWIDNLYRWFTWLPDGAVLRGWLELRRRDRPPDLDLARMVLLDADRRGIPYYTAGVRRLADGLLLLAGEARRGARSDAELDDAVGRVRRLAWQVDPPQPFTCLRLWSS